jgi:stalled ribosome rescue protein Dom34
VAATYVSDRTEAGVDGAHTDTLENIGRIDMGAPLHTIVWVDHREAKLFNVLGSEQDDVVINSHTSVQRLHHQASKDPGQAVDVEFFRRIVAALNHTRGMLITGPGNAKFELKRYIEEHRPDLAPRVSETELDTPGEAGLRALANDFITRSGAARDAS